VRVTRKRKTRKRKGSNMERNEALELLEQLEHSDILMTARCRMVITSPWYSCMLMLMDWTESDRTKTMGVRFKTDGRIECIYNKQFCNQFKPGDLVPILEHEVNHIVKLHPIRHYGRTAIVKSKEGPYLLFNIAADMCINGHRNKPFIENMPEDCCYMPEDIPDNATAEEVYDKLFNDAEKAGRVVTTGVPADGDPTAGRGSMADDHDLWGTSEVDPNTAKQMVRSMVDQASRQAGKIPGNLTDSIAKLKESKVSWKHMIKVTVGRILGGKRKTYSRANRRYRKFGMKGTSTRANVPLMVWLDTSGSMDANLLEQAFTELEGMLSFKLFLGQFDHGVQVPPTPYRRGDWRSIELKGRGGTSFVELFDWIDKNKAQGRMTVILTDSFAEWPTERTYPVTWVVVGNENKAPWGDTVNVTLS